MYFSTGFPSNDLFEQWRKPPASADAIEVKRTTPNTGKLTARITIRTYSPGKYRLSKKLEQILGFSVGSFVNILYALWEYIKLERLQDSETKSLINCNGPLREIFGSEKLTADIIAFKLKEHIHPHNLITINYSVL